MTPRLLTLLAFAFAAVSLHAAETYNIAVIPKGTSHEFWKSIHAGALKAAQELAAQGVKVNINWKGPLREDDRDQQIQVVENFTVRRTSGIVLAPLDSKALVAPVENALRAKKLLGGKGKVILLRYQVGSASTEAREKGFLDTIKKNSGIELISSDQYSGPTRDSAYQAAQNLLNRFGAQVQGWFAPCEPVAIGVMLALRDKGMGGGKVKLVGFDTGTQSVEGMKKGDVQALVVQNPMKMGYLGVMTAVQHLQGKKVEKVIDTGVIVATMENMNQPDVKELVYPPFEKYLK
ncbi:MAG: substrate-binding domain-containing protein [Verrucomicrobia bacterium]|nr:substrate-binding domain-containing protein [Verrucomicrobiota bacterium]